MYDFIEDDLKSSEDHSRIYSISFNHNAKVTSDSNDPKIEKLKTPDDFRSFTFIIMEYGEENLREFINNNKKNNSYLHQTNLILSSMVNFLKEIHDLGYIWMNCKPENFVRVKGTNSSIFKAIDFKSCIKLEDNIDSIIIHKNDIRYNPLYSCPTLLNQIVSGNNELLLSKKYDIFSFGLVLYETYNINNNNSLWEDLFINNEQFKLNNNIIETITNDNIIDIFKNYFNNENYCELLTLLINDKLNTNIIYDDELILNILSECLIASSNSRCSIDDILNKSYFNNNYYYYATESNDYIHNNMNKNYHMNIIKLFNDKLNLINKLIDELSVDVNKDNIDINKMKNLSDKILKKVKIIENSSI